MLMESDAPKRAMCTLIRDVGEVDGGLFLSLHSGITDRLSRCITPSDVIKLWTSEVNQETSPSHSEFSDTLI